MSTNHEIRIQRRPGSFGVGFNTGTAEGQQRGVRWETLLWACLHCSLSGIVPRLHRNLVLEWALLSEVRDWEPLLDEDANLSSRHQHRRRSSAVYCADLNASELRRHVRTQRRIDSDNPEPPSADHQSVLIGHLALAQYHRSDCGAGDGA